MVLITGQVWAHQKNHFAIIERRMDLGGEWWMTTSSFYNKGDFSKSQVDNMFSIITIYRYIKK